MKTEESKDTKLVEENNTDSRKEEGASKLKATAVMGASAILGGAATSAAMGIWDKPVTPDQNDDPTPPVETEQDTETPSDPVQGQEEELEVLHEPGPIVSMDEEIAEGNINSEDEISVIEVLEEPEISISEETAWDELEIDEPEGYPVYEEDFPGSEVQGRLEETDDYIIDVSDLDSDDLNLLGDNIQQDLTDTIDLV